jgi:hypothetical protein
MPSVCWIVWYLRRECCKYNWLCGFLANRLRVAYAPADVNAGALVFDLNHNIHFVLDIQVYQMPLLHDKQELLNPSDGDH